MIRWFYCLDIPEAIALVVIATAAFRILQICFGEKRFWTPAVYCLIAVWLVTVVCITVVNREASAARETSWIPFYSYYLAFSGVSWESLRSNLMNVLLFYPAGLLVSSVLPRKWKPWRKILPVMAAGCVLSLSIELSQYFFHLGLAETDDVIHNTLGAVIGAVIGAFTLC